MRSYRRNRRERVLNAFACEIRWRTNEQTLNALTSHLIRRFGGMGKARTFFVGAIVSKFMGGYVVGMSVVGFAIFIFLAAAIGRHLASGK